MKTDSAPWVTVVTPSFNQGRFLRATIDSVLAQDYPNIEYLVIDGGSSDDTLEILSSYGDRLHWVSEKDEGQSQAINKGFRRARGEILAWLNSDDVYAPGAVEKAARILNERPEIGLVYGRGEILDESGDVVGPFQEIERFSLWRLLFFLDYILQPATFFRRSLVHELGYLNERLEFAMDWDLWIRLAARADVVFLDEVLARSREHGASKTRTGGWRRIRELGGLTRNYAGRFWTPGVQLYALDTLRRGAHHRLPSWLTGLVDKGTDNLSRRIYDGAAMQATGRLGPDGRVVLPRRWGGASLLFETHHVSPQAALQVELRCGGDVLARQRVNGSGRYLCDVEFPHDPAEPFVELGVRLLPLREGPASWTEESAHLVLCEARPRVKACNRATRE